MKLKIPEGVTDAVIDVGGRSVPLTNLNKLFWKELGVTKRQLLQYYADVAPVLLPHIAGRPMVMKRYPNGAEGDFFYMKRAPSPRPEWIETCEILHNAGPVKFPIVQDLATLLWIINLGCIDLNPWYAVCSDHDRPDFLHFDLDPGPGSDFDQVRDTAFALKAMLDKLKLPSYAKTTGSKGLHIYVPIVRDPLQKEVWTVAKAVAQEMEVRHPDLVTAEYRKTNRPHRRVLVDYNQNAWGRTLASIYSVRPSPAANVSTPVTWEELGAGASITDFTMFNVPARIAEVGDLWKAVLGKRRVDLRKVFALAPAAKQGAAEAEKKVAQTRRRVSEKT